MTRPATPADVVPGEGSAWLLVAAIGNDGLLGWHAVLATDWPSGITYRCPSLWPDGYGRDFPSHWYWVLLPQPEIALRHWEEP